MCYPSTLSHLAAVDGSPVALSYSQTICRKLQISAYGRATSSCVFQFKFTPEKCHIVLSSKKDGATHSIDLSAQETYVSDGFGKILRDGLKQKLSLLRRKMIESVAEKCKCLMDENAKGNNPTNSLDRVRFESVFHFKMPSEVFAVQPSYFGHGLRVSS